MLDCSLWLLDSLIRWNRAKGEAISKTDTFWYTDEPNVKEFDYTTRKTSPITEEAYKECTSNPSYECTVLGIGQPNYNNTVYSCSQPSGGFLRRPSFIVNADPVTTSFCAASDASLCLGNINSLFVSFDKVKNTTFDASPACMAMYGPNVDDERIATESATGFGEYDYCSLLFDFKSDVETYDYAKYFDLKCNQSTRALMCSIIGS